MSGQVLGGAPRDAQPRLPQALRTGLAGVSQGLRSALRICLATVAGRIGLGLVAVHLTLALIGPLLAPYSPTSFNYLDNGDLKQFLGPSLQHWLGTDQFGRDILSRVMSGATSIITVSVAGAASGIIAGTLVGMSSGYKGGRIDEIVMRVMDGLMSFPSLLLALLVMTTLAFRPAPFEWIQPYWQQSLIVFTIATANVPRVARVMRSTTLTLKTLEFVQSARLRGEAAPYIIFREILPSALPILGVEMSIRLSYAILLVSSLGFLGMGVQPPSPDWGLMISQSRQFLVTAPWVALAPAAAVASLVVGVNLLVDGIRQAQGLPKEDVA